MDAQATLDAYAAEMATRARDTGLQASMHNDQEWHDRVLAWIEGLTPGTEFSADDVRREWGASSAAGSVFRVARRRGLIDVVGLAESGSPSRRRGVQRVWRRTLRGGGASS
jgi:hypothetical protein